MKITNITPPEIIDLVSKLPDKKKKYILTLIPFDFDLTNINILNKIQGYVSGSVESLMNLFKSTHDRQKLVNVINEISKLTEPEISMLNKHLSAQNKSVEITPDTIDDVMSLIKSITRQSNRSKQQPTHIETTIENLQQATQHAMKSKPIVDTGPVTITPETLHVVSNVLKISDQPNALTSTELTQLPEHVLEHVVRMSVDDKTKHRHETPAVEQHATDITIIDQARVETKTEHVSESKHHESQTVDGKTERVGDSKQHAIEPVKIVTPDEYNQLKERFFDQSSPVFHVLETIRSENRWLDCDIMDISDQHGALACVASATTPGMYRIIINSGTYRFKNVMRNQLLLALHIAECVFRCVLDHTRTKYTLKTLDTLLDEFHDKYFNVFEELSE